MLVSSPSARFVTLLSIAFPWLLLGLTLFFLRQFLQAHALISLELGSALFLAFFAWSGLIWFSGRARNAFLIIKPLLFNFSFLQMALELGLKDLGRLVLGRQDALSRNFFR